MCSRYDIHHSPETIRAAIDAMRLMFDEFITHDPGITEPDLEAFAPNYNLAPTNLAPVVVIQNGTAAIEGMRAGFVPSYTSDIRECRRPVNARSEGILTSGCFRSAFKRRRCLVPMSGYYEWQKAGQLRLPYYIHRADSKLFFVAGVWEKWRGQDAPVLSFATITVSANAMIQSIPHNRMLAIMHGEAARKWMDPATTPEEAVALLTPDDGDAFVMHRVSRRMNRVGVNDAECIAPEADEAVAQQSLFG